GGRGGGAGAIPCCVSDIGGGRDGCGSGRGAVGASASGTSREYTRGPESSSRSTSGCEPTCVPCASRSIMLMIDVSSMPASLPSSVLARIVGGRDGRDGRECRVAREAALIDFGSGIGSSSSSSSLPL